MIVSTRRTAALGKYLVTTSKHLAGQQDEAAQTNLSRRQRLHILYLVNDLLHHSKYHTSSNALLANLVQPLQPLVAELWRNAALEAKVRVSKRLSDLVDLWKEEDYFGEETITQLHDALSGTTDTIESTVETLPKSDNSTKELPYILPSTHGDASLPFYDLPAGNLMRHIVPNSSQPIRPSEVRALQLSAGPADGSLVNALKDFLKDVEGIKDSLPSLEEVGLSPEVDELGQISYHDEAGGLIGDSYYGWSRRFCDKMKKRGRGGSDTSSRRSRSRSTESRRSITPRKRRRRSHSSREQSRSSDSYSRSPSRSRHGHRQRNGSQIRSRSPSRSRSYSPPYSPKPNRPQNVEPARTDSSNTNVRQFQPPAHAPPPVVPPVAMRMPYPPPPFMPTGIAAPPRPPNWLGPWPPPPPPPPFIQGRPTCSNQSFTSPPPPPNFPYPPANWPSYPNAPPGQNSHYTGGR